MRVNTPEEGFPDLEEVDVALLGVRENRGGNQNGPEEAPDRIRQGFYGLSLDRGWRVADLGNIRAGDRVEDTYFAVSGTLEELVPSGIIPVVIGGTADLAYAMQMGYTRMDRITDMVFVGPELAVSDADADRVHDRNFLSKIVLHQGDHLFNYSHLGHQSYYTTQREEDIIEGLNFDIHRLGKLQQNIPDYEPVIRNGDLFGISLNAIRASEARGTTAPGPNGLYGDEACQLCRYAGISDQLTGFGLFDMDPGKDGALGLTAELAGQMIWYFIQGFYQRKGEDLYEDRSGFTRFNVEVEEGKGHSIVFHKSERTDRWWMEVPYPGEAVSRFQRKCFVPCRYDDYLLASNGEIPDQWWRTYQKLS